MEELIIERERLYNIISSIKNEEFDLLVDFCQPDFNDIYSEYIFIKKRRFENIEDTIYKNIKSISIQLKNFYEFKNSTSILYNIIEDMELYLFKHSINENLYNKIKQIHFILENIKLLIKSRLINGYSILDNIEEADTKIQDSNLLFSDEEKEYILNNINNNILLRHETMIGNEIIDMDSPNISYNGSYFSKNNYIDYFKLLCSNNYLNHLTYLFIHKWQFKINQSTEISHYYGGIERIKPSNIHISFIINMKELYQKINFILYYFDF